jgi:nicotinate-nucleotide--dimethylbenzimidazole phosphoribosyltransferase
LHAPQVHTALDALAAWGGFEIAVMVGAMIEAAKQARVVIVDGFICGAAALVATKLDETCRNCMVFSHQSAESGHAAMLQALNAKALLHLGLRLGEGTGAVLAVPLLRSACAFMQHMASFESAAVSGKA